jgi:uncharacterized membrane protein YdbT with pleckstrin-like domain
MVTDASNGIRSRPPMAPKLQPGERVIYEGHPSWRAILDFYVKGILLTAVICAVFQFITDETGTTSLLAIVGVSLTILIGFIKRVATNYAITDRRLHIKRGIVSRTIQETRLERVQNVNFSQGVLQRMLQIGDVDFDTAAGDDYNFVFAGVADPAEVVHKVDEATHHAGTNALGEPVAAPQQAPPQQAPPPPAAPTEQQPRPPQQ